MTFDFLLLVPRIDVFRGSSVLRRFSGYQILRLFSVVANRESSESSSRVQDDEELTPPHDISSEQLTVN